MNPNAKKMDVDDVPRQRPFPATDQHSNPYLVTLTKNGDVPAALAVLLPEPLPASCCCSGASSIAKP